MLDSVRLDHGAVKNDALKTALVSLQRRLTHAEEARTVSRLGYMIYLRVLSIGLTCRIELASDKRPHVVLERSGCFSLCQICPAPFSFPLAHMACHMRARVHCSQHVREGEGKSTA